MKKFISVLFLMLVGCGSNTQAADHYPSEWPWKGINMLSTTPYTELDRIASQRIKHVFLDVQPSKMSGGMTEAVAWLNAALDRCRALELRCSVRFDDVPLTSVTFWDDPAQLDAAFTQIETIIRGVGNRKVWHWHFLSEPTYSLPTGAIQPPEWPAFFERIRVMLRSVRPRDWLAYSPGPWGLAGGFKGLQPFADNRIIYNFHSYTPHPYTHQGIYAQYPYGVTWPGEPWPGSPYPSQAGIWDANRLRSSMQAVRDFQVANNVPVMVGSFSAVRWAPDAEQYILDSAEIFNDYEWGYAYWCYGSYNGWNPDYDTTYDPANYKQQYIGLNSIRWDTLRKILD